MCNHPRTKKAGLTKAGTQRHKCLDCGKRFTDSTSTLEGMRIGTDKAAQIVQCMMEGVGVRGTARLAGVCKDTVLDTLLLVGQRCQFYLENAITDVAVQDVSVDELWSFVGMKERTRKILSRPAGSVGDCYCFVGMERKTRLILAYHVGARDNDNGWAFVRKLKHACHEGPKSLATAGGPIST